MSKLCEINIFSISLQRCITELKGETLSRLLLKKMKKWIFFNFFRKNQKEKKKKKKKKQDPNT